MGEDEITAMLNSALQWLKAQKPSREISLAITKVEEALMWYARVEMK